MEKEKILKCRTHRELLNNINDDFRQWKMRKAKVGTVKDFCKAEGISIAQYGYATNRWRARTKVPMEVNQFAVDAYVSETQGIRKDIVKQILDYRFIDRDDYGNPTTYEDIGMVVGISKQGIKYHVDRFLNWFDKNKHLTTN